MLLHKRRLQQCASMREACTESQIEIHVMVKGQNTAENAKIVCCTRNSIKNPQLSFLQFPADSIIRKEWTHFVNTTRSNFSISQWSCASHLNDDCLDTPTKLKQQFEFTPKTALKKSAIPTLKAPNIATTWSGDKMKSQRVKGSNRGGKGEQTRVITGRGGHNQASAAAEVLRPPIFLGNINSTCACQSIFILFCPLYKINFMAVVHLQHA